MAEYEGIFRIPLKDVPDDVPIQKAKVELEIYVMNKIPDAELVEFKKVE